MAQKWVWLPKFDPTVDCCSSECRLPHWVLADIAAAAGGGEPGVPACGVAICVLEFETDAACKQESDGFTMWSISDACIRYS
jgi:hypothetical protein